MPTTLLLVGSSIKRPTVPELKAATKCTTGTVKTHEPSLAGPALGASGRALASPEGVAAARPIRIPRGLIDSDQIPRIPAKAEDGPTSTCILASHCTAANTPVQSYQKKRLEPIDGYCIFCNRLQPRKRITRGASSAVRPRITSSTQTSRRPGQRQPGRRAQRRR
jgi:hypothetical protein